MQSDNKNNKKQYDDPGLWASFAVPTQVLVYIVGGAALGFIVGHFIDVWLRSTPVATFIGLLLGLAVGIFAVYRLVTNLK